MAAAILGLTSAAGCGEAASLEGRSCPCAGDNVCCREANRCVAKGTSCDALYGGDAGDGGDASDSGDPHAGDPSKRLRVFVSSTVHQGNLGGLQGADAICSSAARKAGISGKWVAFVSDSTTRSIDRVRGDGPWYLVDRKTLAFPNRGALALDPRTPINLDEAGERYAPAFVWTGTNPHYPPTSCSDWTSTSGTGTFVSTGSLYMNVVDVNCTELHSLLCFEQR